MTARSASGDRTTDFLPYLVAATFFMEYLDTTVIATALPQMAHTFGVGPNALVCLSLTSTVKSERSQTRPCSLSRAWALEPVTEYRTHGRRA
ncbi:hypothetical protein KTD15_32950, partial [Burkholderia multivorans]|nr:hypothetical protein [Burkholderia multivorans]